MRSSFKIIIVALLCAIATVSCKDSSSNGDDSSSVEGIWLLNSDEGDVFYVQITSVKVRFFDYQGDAFDEGEDCYIIDTGDILEVNGDMYKLADSENPELTIDVRIKVNGNTLTVNQTFGDETVTLNYSRYNGNTSSFTPECIEQVQPKAALFGL